MVKKLISGGCSQRLRPLAKAVSLSLGVAAASAAQAQLTTIVNSGFSHNATTVQDKHTTSASTNGSTTGSLSGTTLIDQFEASTGVLTGTTITLDSKYTQKFSGSASGGTSGTTRTTTATGTSSSIFLTAPDGTSKTLSAPAGLTGTCSSKASGCTFSGISASADLDTTLTIPQANLNTYVGAGTVAVTDGATLTVLSNRGGFTSSQATYVADWDGVLTVTYSYLLHANASFQEDDDLDTLTINFGTVTQGSADPSRPFSLFNLLGSADPSEVVGLDLDAIAGGGSPFTTDLALFSGLDGGSGLGFNIILDTDKTGSFTATYTLDFSDEDVGASSSRFANGPLTLIVSGVVTAPPVRVPEPKTLMLLGCGLIGLGLGGYRRRHRRGSP